MLRTRSFFVSISFVLLMISCGKSPKELRFNERDIVISEFLNCSNCYINSSSKINNIKFLVEDLKNEIVDTTFMKCSIFSIPNELSSPDYCYLFYDSNSTYIGHYIHTDENTIYNFNRRSLEPNSYDLTFKRTLRYLVSKLNPRNTDEYRSFVLYIFNKILKLRKINKLDDLQDLKNLLDSGISLEKKNLIKNTIDEISKTLFRKELNTFYFYSKSGIGGIWKLTFTKDNLELEMINSKHFQQIIL
ncbi:MAG: hypothetical protein RMJ53_10425 [Chitinophagales bacterium]|nr:hypothetical protein [Candidatus Calescibacterium sp.]MDW8274632.1 hypothetical protein [Chitinophagales bacterium]